MFLLKKVAGALLMPYALGVLLLFGGIALLWAKRLPSQARLLVTAAGVLLAVAGCEPVAKAFLGSLENEFAPIVDTSALRDIGWIVVLGGGHTGDLTLPPATRLTPSALARLAEGIRLHRQLSGSRLLLSGGLSHARTLRQAAYALGVDSTALVLEERTHDTEDEARLISERLAGERFIVVTSALHMPRAAALFRAAGAEIVPAPAEFASRTGSRRRPGYVLPGWRSLSATERSLHEYLGMAWAALGGG